MGILVARATLAEGAEIASKYRLGKQLAETERQADYETYYRGTSATLRVLHCHNANEATALVGGFSLAFPLQHPNLLTIYDFGEEQYCGQPIAWLVMERGEECLGEILRERALDESEARHLLSCVVPTLEFLSEHRLGLSDIHASNIYACGDTIKLSADCISADAAGTESLQVSRLVLEILTGSRESGTDQLNSPFREIANSGGRWRLGQIRAALAGDAVIATETPVASPAQAIPQTEVVFHPLPSVGQPKYRQYAGLAIGGALASAVLCALLIRGAHQTPQPEVATPVRTVQTGTAAPAATLPHPNPAAAGEYASAPKGWGVTAATYDNPADAEKRLNEVISTTRATEARVYSTGSSRAPRYSVVLTAGLTEPQAKKQLARLRRNGAPRSTHITRFD